MKYSHTYSIYFTIHTDEKDPHEVPAEELDDGIRQRINSMGSLEMAEACEYHDTMNEYETYIEVKVRFKAEDIDDAEQVLNNMNYGFSYKPDGFSNEQVLSTEIMSNGYPEIKA